MQTKETTSLRGQLKAKLMRMLQLGEAAAADRRNEAESGLLTLDERASAATERFIREAEMRDLDYETRNIAARIFNAELTAQITAQTPYHAPPERLS
jgi:uncharacterized Ntn-hydrolase superfamily protein